MLKRTHGHVHKVNGKAQKCNSVKIAYQSWMDDWVISILTNIISIKCDVEVDPRSWSQGQNAKIMVKYANMYIIVLTSKHEEMIGYWLYFHIYRNDTSKMF